MSRENHLYGGGYLPSKSFFLIAFTLTMISLPSFFVSSAYAAPEDVGWGVYGWTEKGEHGRIFLALQNDSVVYPSLHLFIYTDTPGNFTVKVNSDTTRTHVDFSSEFLFKLRYGRNTITVSSGNQSVVYSVISSSDISGYVSPPSKEVQEMITKNYLYSEVNTQSLLILVAAVSGVVYGYYRSHQKKLEDMEMIA